MYLRWSRRWLSLRTVWLRVSVQCCGSRRNNEVQYDHRIHRIFRSLLNLSPSVAGRCCTGHHLVNPPPPPSFTLPASCEIFIKNQPTYTFYHSLYRFYITLLKNILFSSQVLLWKLSADCWNLLQLEKCVGYKMPRNWKYVRQNNISWGKVFNRPSCVRMGAVAKATWDPANVWFGKQEESSPLCKDDIWLLYFFYLFYESTVQYWSSFVPCYKSRE